MIEDKAERWKLFRETAQCESVSSLRAYRTRTAQSQKKVFFATFADWLCFGCKQKIMSIICDSQPISFCCPENDSESRIQCFVRFEFLKLILAAKSKIFCMKNSFLTFPLYQTGLQVIGFTFTSWLDLMLTVREEWLGGMSLPSFAIRIYLKSTQ